jgi:DinB superfamily
MDQAPDAPGASTDVTETHALLASARRELARLPAVLDVLLGGLDDPTWRARPVPDEWAPIEIVCHLRDEETEDFGARVRVIVEGGDAFTPIDPERWAAERRYRDDDPTAVVEALRDRRAASLALLARTPAERLGGSRAHPRLGKLSGLDVLAAWVTHDRLHLSQLAGTLARLWATRWTSLQAGYAGPIPYERGDRASPRS